MAPKPTIPSHLYPSSLSLSLSLNRLPLSLSSTPFKTTHPHCSHTPISLRVRKMSAGFLSAAAVPGSPFIGLRPDASGKLSPETGSVAWRARTVSNGSRVHCMKTWNPINNKKFEALSYLPPLSEESIAKEVDYMISKEWIPCLEFDKVGEVHRTNSQIPGYYDGRYWTLWKLPMFGCTDPAQVLREIEECKKAYPNAYIRLLSFDNKRQRQCQCMSFVIQKPTTTTTSANA